MKLDKLQDHVFEIQVAPNVREFCYFYKQEDVRKLNSLEEQPKSKWSIKKRRAMSYWVGYRRGRANGMFYGAFLMYILIGLLIGLLIGIVTHQI